MEWLLLELVDQTVEQTNFDRKKASPLTTLFFEIPATSIVDLDLTAASSLSEALSNEHQFPMLNKVEIHLILTGGDQITEEAMRGHQNEVNLAMCALQDKGVLQFHWD